MIFVIGRRKTAARTHLDIAFEHETTMREWGKDLVDPALPIAAARLASLRRRWRSSGLTWARRSALSLYRLLAFVISRLGEVARVVPTVLTAVCRCDSVKNDNGVGRGQMHFAPSF